jgi:hypothetical protein
MKMMDFYRAVLSAANMVADDGGRISASVGGSTLPIHVNEKRLVLPTHENQANPDKSSIILFHPLNENILHGESDVMVKFRNSVNIALNMRLSVLTFGLLTLATSPSMHNKLKPDQIEMMSVLKDADEKTLELYRSILEKMKPGDTEKCFVHMYIKRNGAVAGKKHRRVAVITFPFYQELCKGEASVFGVTLRKKHVAMFKAMLEQVLPNLGIEGAYNRGSLSDVSPTLEALLLGLVGIASHINVIAEEYGPILSDIADVAYSDQWVDPLQNIDQFINEIRMIPMQAGNEGGTGKEAPAAAPAPLQMTAPPQLGTAAPVHSGLVPVVSHGHAPAPAATDDGLVKTASGGLDLAAMMRGSHPQPGMVGMPGMQGMVSMGMPYGYGVQMLPPGAAGVRDPRAGPAYDRPGAFGAAPQHAFSYNNPAMTPGGPAWGQVGYGGNYRV